MILNLRSGCACVSDAQSITCTVVVACGATAPSSTFLLQGACNSDKSRGLCLKVIGLCTDEKH